MSADLKSQGTRSRMLFCLVKHPLDPWKDLDSHGHARDIATPFYLMKNSQKEERWGKILVPRNACITTECAVYACQRKMKEDSEQSRESRVNKRRGWEKAGNCPRETDGDHIRPGTHVETYRYSLTTFIVGLTFRLPLFQSTSFLNIDNVSLSQQSGNSLVTPVRGCFLFAV